MAPETIVRSGQPDPEVPAKVQIYLNTPLPGNAVDQRGRPLARFPTNKLKTTKYTPLTFLPKNLFEQFRRVANCFFLLLAILQLFPTFRTIHPLVAALPLIVIITLTAIKNGVEDWKRHSTDSTVNHRVAFTLGNWTNVNVQPVSKKSLKQRWRHYSHKAFWGFMGLISQFFHNLIDRTNRVANDIDDDLPPAASIRERPTSATGRIFPASPIGVTGSMLVAPGPTAGGRATSAASRRNPTVDPNILSGPRSTADPFWKETFWKDVRVGDIIFLRNNEFIPADILILSTSEPEGLCYVQTKNLDGETNLKIRRGLTETATLKTAAEYASLQLRIDSEPPTANLFSYNGTVVTKGMENEPAKKVSVNLNSMLLRGCILRNTEYVVGIVVFTGVNTKIQLNSGETPSKRTVIEKAMNPQVMINLLIMFGMCVATALGSRLWLQTYQRPDVPFSFATNDHSENPDLNAFLEFWSSLIAYQNLVPVSLILTVELVKTIQAFFIYQDAEMYHPDTDTPCTPRNWALSDDLGQIEYIFSDKTGTLTRNVMEFRKCSIGGIKYGGEQQDEVEKEDKPLMGGDMALSFPSMRVLTTCLARPYASDEPTFYDSRMFEEIQASSPQGELIVQFFTLLAACHTVLARRPDPADNFDIEYKAQSPDEAALVQAAKDCGFTFLNRELSEIEIDVMGQPETFTLLNVLEFNSTRKRMSIIIRNAEGLVILMCKGADNVIFERLAAAQDTLSKLTGKHLEEFADEGLRTLCLGYRILPEGKYEEWSKQYHEASTSLEKREEKMDACAELLEKDLTLLGVTAIEDRLQEGVPEAIAMLARAGIKIWVLTGDKLETAVSIGFSSNLLRHEMSLIVIKAPPKAPPDLEDVRKQIYDALAKFWTPDGTPRHEQPYALIIDGPSLKFGLEDECKDVLLTLACRCRAVICCRVSPLQKAQVVELVKNGKRVMTCAIGDGANDVSMIQAAHVGIGISGEEGLQAVMASDYAFAQFRYLCRLLLVHGRYSYLRTGNMILNFFYKNLVWTVVLFLYQFYNGFSNELAYDFVLMLIYNTVFTCTPVMTLGIFDKDIDQESLLRMPQLYLFGLRQELYTKRNFASYMFDGVYQGLICFYVPLGVYQSSSVSGANGRSPDLAEMGTCMAISAIVTANLFTGFNTHAWPWPHHLSIWLSAALAYIVVAIYGANRPDSRVSDYNMVDFKSLSFWLTNLICIILCILPRYVLRFALRTYRPTDANIVEEMEHFRLLRPLDKAIGNSMICLPEEASAPAKELASAKVKSPLGHRLSNIVAPSPKTPVRLMPAEMPAVEKPESDVAVPEARMTNMRTGRVTRFRGFSFSQDVGMVDVLCHDHLRRSRTIHSVDRNVSHTGTGAGGPLPPIYRGNTIRTHVVEVPEDETQQHELPETGTEGSVNR